MIKSPYFSTQTFKTNVIGLDANNREKITFLLSIEPIAVVPPVLCKEAHSSPAINIYYWKYINMYNRYTILKDETWNFAGSEYNK